MTSSEGTAPTFTCVANGKEQWAFQCPHCRVLHYHGAFGGHRTAHCDDGPYKETGYYLKGPEKH